MGSPEIGATILNNLLKRGVIINSVITQPDRPCGRGCAPKETPVKSLAKKTGIKTYEPKSKEELTKTISKIMPDLCIVAAYGMIIPKKALDIPKYGMINFHPSLLPKYRGPSPITAAIINGDKTTGVSIIKVTENIDAGPIILQKKIKITKKETTESLSQKTAHTGSGMIYEALKKELFLKKNEIEQNEKHATYTKIIKKENGLIDLSKQTSAEIERMSRAYCPWPGVYFYCNGKKIDLFGIKIDKKISLAMGKIAKKNDTLYIGTKKYAISPTLLKIESKKTQTAKEFICGYKNFINTKFDK